MKKLIKKILKESVDNRIVDLLIKMNLTSYNDIEKFLEEVGYDYNEIDEIYYSYFKTISGLELTPSNWMNYYFSPNQLEIVKFKDYPNSVFFKKDGKVVMEDGKFVMEQTQSKKYKYFWFSYNEIWSFFESVFGMERQEIQEVLSYWVKETLKLKGYTPNNINMLKLNSRWNRLSI